MKKLDQQMQKRVWNRVYAVPAPKLTPPQRQILQQALRRCESNQILYEKMSQHEIYADAFRHLAAETAEHIKMLRQMLK